MYWYNRTATHTFYAYYPYNASNQSNVVPMPVLANQQVSTAVDVACDMLVTGPKQQAYPAGSSVAFVFSHAFSVLQFNITMGVINTYTLKSLTLRGGNTASGSSGYGIVNTVNTVAQIGYNLVTGAVQAAANNSSVYAQTLTKSIPSTGLIGSIPVTVYVLALPGQYLNPADRQQSGYGLREPVEQHLLGRNQICLQCQNRRDHHESSAAVRRCGEIARNDRAGHGDKFIE